MAFSIGGSVVNGCLEATPSSARFSKPLKGVLQLYTATITVIFKPFALL